MLTRILFAVFLWTLFLNSAFAEDQAEQRAMFLQAKQALATGNYASFSRLSEQLKNYPLYPYLRYYYLQYRLDEISNAEVMDFIQKYADTPLAERLRYIWLNHLAEEQQWSDFLKYYHPTNDAQLQCQYLQAGTLQGINEQSDQTLTKLWLQGHIQPAACEQLFFKWHQSGKLNTNLLWRRIELAFASNSLALAKQLISWLPSATQSHVQLWLRVRANPNLVTQADLFKTLDERKKKILVDGIESLTKKDPAKVVELWPTLQTTYDFDVADQQIITRAIAIGLARFVHPEAADWLDKVEPAYVNVVVREWRIRTALLAQDWSEVRAQIEALPANERVTVCWRYWYARALAASGETTTAEAIYRNLATQIDYYGLLASQQLRQPYRPIIQNSATNAQVMNTVAAKPAIVRAHELYILNQHLDARREWQWAINHMDKQQLAAAGQLAKQWHWYDRMLTTAIKGGLYRDTTLRFPLAFRQQVVTAAEKAALDPAWIYGIMRQESHFMTDAKSNVGALGLMQLMPATARLLLKVLHFDLNENILDAQINIQLGSRYLKDLYARYDSNIAAATAAYNVGPSRVDKFLPFYKEVGEDVWVEILPWQETRNYVKSVLLNMAIYKMQLKR